ncbi:hypothetical protein I6J22_05675 [Corynebacterium kroppenstedtii]|uniref:Uncharacterized protein n=1 Tax=Corynebacterium kroppenstedtii (strain DSM 44385 / JCM 11950 / CIP 105744 / CCUG 35717) TaxID=645127 RepID=C4LGJ9_CORK4|nr:hypothetical protein [Corynebacterium kroppenstedtii]ACR16954.1 hypothetical protein ckrop_0161 [Corynebacterium kroppenstedtii DSM 44385]QRP09761.1 hypothetical protein I6J22_05675 [Corynebacterium kroppenstedtii]
MGIESDACLLRPSVASAVDLAVVVLAEALQVAKIVAGAGSRARVD